MPSNQWMKSALLFSITLSAAVPSVVFSSQEAEDRIVDQAAVDVQNEADADLALLARRHRGTAREAELLLRLSELRMEIAEGMFRVAYAPGEQNLKKAYFAKLESAVESLTRILSAHGKAAEAPRALFLRAKARKELGADAAALKDYEAFLAKNPSRVEAPFAAVSIADISIRRNAFKRAISVLVPVLKTPSHPLYTVAAQKRAWAFYASSNPMAAVTQLRTLSKHYAGLKNMNSGDGAVRDAVLADLPSIAYSAFSSNPKAFSLAQANALMRSYDVDAGYRRMALQFMDHLRTADRERDLRDWKTIVLKSDPARPENLEMLIATFEYDLERESFADVTRTASEMAFVIGKNLAVEGSEDSRKLVIKAAERLTKRVSDYRTSDKTTAKANQAERDLHAVMTAFDGMTDAKDARRLVLRWNLAETYFNLKQFEKAAQTYRWVELHWIGKDDARIARDVSKKTAALKAISSRYEALLASGTVPSKLEAKASIPAIRDANASALLKEWILWIDRFAKDYKETLEHFGFEANRALYAAGSQDQAMDRMKSFTRDLPRSKLSMAAASLVVDTWIARSRWDRVEEEARDFAGRKQWAVSSFNQDMTVKAAGAKFKRIENAFAAKNFKESLSHANGFMKSYPTSNLAIDANGFACNSLLKANELSSAVDCFEGLAKRFPNTPASLEALRSAARIEDEQMSFIKAADAYRRYLSAMNSSKGSKLKADESLVLRRRVLQLTRASGDAARMESLASEKRVCSPKLESECELNVALAALIRSSDSKTSPSAALSKMSNSRRSLRAIWAMTALEQWKSLDSRSAERALKTLVAQWDSTDASVRYFLIARATKVVPAMLQEERQSMAMTATEAAITGRMKRLQALEARATLVSGIPVTSVQASALENVFFGYSDLIQAIRSIPVAKNATPGQTREHQQLLSSLTQPLVLKSRKVRDSFMTLDLREKAGLDAKRADLLFSGPIAKNASHERLRREWLKAIRGENWSRVSFLSDEVSDLKGVPANWSKAARAISLATAGASAEARIVFGDACRNSTGSTSLRDACQTVAKSRKKGRG